MDEFVLTKQPAIVCFRSWIGACLHFQHRSIMSMAPLLKSPLAHHLPLAPIRRHPLARGSNNNRYGRLRVHSCSAVAVPQRVAVCWVRVHRHRYRQEHHLRRQPRRTTDSWRASRLSNTKSLCSCWRTCTRFCRRLCSRHRPCTRSCKPRSRIVARHCIWRSRSRSRRWPHSSTATPAPPPPAAAAVAATTNARAKLSFRRNAHTIRCANTPNRSYSTAPTSCARP